MPNIYKFNIGADFVSKACLAITSYIKGMGKETIRIALSGGESPRAVYANLSKADIDWGHVELFLVDERSDGSNRKMIEESLTSKIVGLKAFYHFGKNYEAKITERGRPFFDLVLLGLGSDGHTASIFPHTEAVEEIEKVILETQSPTGIKERMTLSFPALLSAEKIIFLIRGAGKKEILEKWLESNASEMEIPAKVMLAHDNIDIYYDYSHQ